MGRKKFSEGKFQYQGNTWVIRKALIKKRTVYRRLNKHLLKNRILSRKISQITEETYKSVSVKPIATRSLERAKIDNTTIELIVVDDVERKPIKRPYLTMVIDGYSREILGFHLGFEPPSYLNTGKE